MPAARPHSAFTRGIDLSLPSNRFAVFLPLVASIAALILILAGHLPTITIIYLPLLSFVAWVLAREISPDYPGVALITSIATLFIAIFLSPQTLSIPLLTSIILIMRLLQGTKTQHITHPDILIFTALQTLILLYTKEQLLALPAITTILLLSASRPKNLLKISIPSILILSAATIHILPGFHFQVTWQNVLIVTLIGTYYLLTQIITCRILSKCDSGENLSKNRVRAARTIALGWLLLNLASAELKTLNILPLLVAMLIAPIYEQIRLGLPVHQSQTET